MFRSVEQELEAIQRCKANRAEWDEKSKIYEEWKNGSKEELDKMESAGLLEESAT
jgi:hypothetical protein